MRPVLPATAMLLLPTAVAALAASPPWTSVPGPQDRPTFRANVAVVAVDVSVRVRNNPVPGLGPTDFELTDKGVPQRIDSVTTGSIPLDLSLLLDVSGSSYGWLTRLKENVDRGAELLAPVDLLRVLAFGIDAREVMSFQSPQETTRLRAIPYAGGTALRDALFLAIAHDSGPDRRHLIVAFTDGTDTASVLGPALILEAGRASDASVHFVHLEGNSGNPPLVPVTRRPEARLWDGRPLARELEDLVESTGGRVYRSFLADVPEAIDRVLDDYRSRYLLRYYPAGVLRGGWHDIAVRVPRHPRAEVRARRGYFGG